MDGLYEYEKECEHWLNVAMAALCTALGIDLSEAAVRYAVAKVGAKARWQILTPSSGCGIVVIDPRMAERPLDVLRAALLGTLYAFHGYKRAAMKEMAERIGMAYGDKEIWPSGMSDAFAGILQGTLASLPAFPADTDYSNKRPKGKGGSVNHSLAFKVSGEQYKVHGGKEAIAALYTSLALGGAEVARYEGKKAVESTMAEVKPARRSTSRARTPQAAPAAGEQAAAA